MQSRERGLGEVLKDDEDSGQGNELLRLCSLTDRPTD
jgi:hypothetical protein